MPLSSTTPRSAAVPRALLATALLLTASTANADESAAPASDPEVTVHIDSTRPATVLEKLQSTEGNYRFDLPMLPYDKGTWGLECLTPCHTSLKSNAIYRVKGFNGVTESSPFTLPPGASAIHVVAGSAGATTAGRVIALIGGIVAASALTTALAADDRTTRNTSLVIAGGAALPILVGTVIWALSGTKVTFE